MSLLQRPSGPSPVRPSLMSAQTLIAPRWWSGRQRGVALGVFAVAFVLLGEVGQTLPPNSEGRMYPVEWWNWVTLSVSALLMGMIAATFVVQGGRRALAGAGTGGAGTVAAMVMACPVCSPLAIPLLGTSGLLAFLVPERGLIALVSVAILALTLLLRLRASTTCAVKVIPTPAAA